MEVVAGSLAERRFAALYERNGKVCGVLGMNNPRLVMKLRQLVADQVSWADGLEAAAGII